MRKIYLKPAIRAVIVDEELMQFTSGETDKTTVDPGHPQDPGNAMSREDQGFSLWDEE